MVSGWSSPSSRNTSSIRARAWSRVSPGPSRTAARRVARAGSAWPSAAWAAAGAKREAGSAASAARRALASSDGHLGVVLDRAQELDRLGRAALAQGQVGQAGPGGQVVGVLLQDLAPAGGGFGRVELGRGRGGPVGLARQQGLDEALDHLGRLGADELVDQAATGEGLDRRDALDLEGGGQALVLVDVDPGQHDLAALALHRPLQHRGQGVAGPAPVGPEVQGLEEQLLELEARQTKLKELIGQAPPPAPRLHPKLAEVYRATVAGLHAALNDPTRAPRQLTSCVD